MKVTGLQTNHRTEHPCVDDKQPVFSWRLEGTEENIYQDGYRLRVWQENALKWDSKEVLSNVMSGVAYEGEALESDKKYTWEVTVNAHSSRGSVTLKSQQTFFHTAFLHKTDWKGCFIGETKDHEYHLFRKAFCCRRRIESARLYVCGLGHAECFLNGKRVTENVLEPGWSVYDKTCFYVVYDVHDKLSEGQNALLIKLGDGMFNVPGGRYVYYKRSYGKCKVLAQLEITYEDGSRDRLVTDSSWRMTPSPIDFCCIYGGEDYDARLWKQEYLTGDYEEGAVWENVVCVEPPEGELRAMPMESVKVMETYTPVSVRYLGSGAWLYDLGKNFSGWVRIRIHTNGRAAGQKIVLAPKELVGKNGEFDQKAWNSYAWTYLLDERETQEFAPDFTYTGFRYVVMTGAMPQGASLPAKDFSLFGDNVPVLETLQGEFLYPELEQAGDFECSNELFQKIHQLVLQAIKSNTKSYFTDCPQREKLGWLEQTHLIGPSIMYNFNVLNLYDKILGDMGDSMHENGMVPDICPEYVTGFEKWHSGFLDSPEWGSAIVLACWYRYRRYGDISLLEKQYPVMKRYVEYLAGKAHHEMLHHGLGDWLDIGPCTPYSQNTPVALVASCIYYYDLDVMRQTAQLLGKSEEAAEYKLRMERMFEEYQLQFLDDQTGRYATGSQTAQAMSLMVGLVPAKMEEKALEQLCQDVIKRKYAITAGDIGHPFLIAALMKYGKGDLINEMTVKTDTPGYGYQVVNGATALTEEWDGPDPENPHGSQNHLMLGSIEEWFYGGLGGMELIRDGLALHEVRIRPQPADGVDWVRAWTLHPYGKIKVEWSRQEAQVCVNVTIPPNLTAHLETPEGEEIMQVGSGCYSYVLRSKC